MSTHAKRNKPKRPVRGATATKRLNQAADKIKAVYSEAVVRLFDDRFGNRVGSSSETIQSGKTIVNRSDGLELVGKRK